MSHIQSFLKIVLHLSSSLYPLVNGNWGEWSDYDTCPVTCGGGRHGRIRLCNSPSSAHGGVDCLMTGETVLRGQVEEEFKTCGDASCPGKQ